MRKDQRAFVLESAERVFHFLIMQLGLWNGLDEDKTRYFPATMLNAGSKHDPSALSAAVQHHKKSSIDLLFDGLYTSLHESLILFSDRADFNDPSNNGNTMHSDRTPSDKNSGIHKSADQHSVHWPTVDAEHVVESPGLRVGNGRSARLSRRDGKC